VTDEAEQPNEILAAAAQVKARAEGAAEAVADKTKNWPLGRIGLGVGIGSAAVAAAVLFVNRNRDHRK
jgi:hypothetical protein